jgi:hypothetical protein
MTDWKKIEHEQKKVCDKIAVNPVFADKEMIVGIADNVSTSAQPINGLRHPAAEGTSGWFIWASENYSNDSGFFKPHCLKHLQELRPDIIKFLALPPGYRFLIDNQGYEDVWYDEGLLSP